MDMNTFNTGKNAAPPLDNFQSADLFRKAERPSERELCVFIIAAAGEGWELWFVYKARGGLALVLLKKIFLSSFSYEGWMIEGLAKTKKSG